MKELLELRNMLKRKKPRFRGQENYKKVRIKERWRKPKGLNSKVRQNKAGKPAQVSSGYRSPRLVRGLTRDGLRPIMVHCLSDLAKIKSKEEGIVISANVGTRKKIDIIKEAQKKGMVIINIKNPDEYLKRIEDKIKLRKEARKKKIEEKKKEDKKTAKKSEEKGLAEKVSDEEKKEIEKKEKDKLLIKREVK